MKNKLSINKVAFGRTGWFSNLFLLLFVLPLFAQIGPTNVQFQHYTIENGLSDNVITSLFQDIRGLVWIGTRNGLNYFDGKSFTCYYPSELVENITDDCIGRIAEDKNGNILFFNGDGLCIFDWRKKDMRLVFPITGKEKDNLISDFIIDKTKTIWVKTKKKMEHYDGNFHLLNTYNFAGIKHKKALPIDEIIMCDNENNIWFYESGILNVFDSKDGKIYNAHEKTRFSEIFNHFPCHIAQDKDNNYWFLANDSLFSFNAGKALLTIHEKEHKDNKKGVLIANSGKIWINTIYRGLYVYDIASHKTEVYRHDPNNPNSITLNIFNCLIQDKDGNIWIGTNVGLDVNKTVANKFTVFDPVAFSADGEGTNKVELSWPVILKDKIYLPTSDGQILIDSKSLKTENFRFDNRHFSIKDDYTSNLLINDHQILATQWMGVVLYNINNSKLSPSPFIIRHPALLDTVRVISTYKDGRGRIWFGMARGQGIMCWDTNNNSFTHFSKTDSIRHYPINSFTTAAEGNDGNIFFGYEHGGIQLFNDRTHSFTPLQIDANDPINRDYFYDLLNGQNGVVWMATSRGLIKYSVKNNSYRLFTKKDGLMYSMIFGMALDGHGHLWLGSKIGLSSLDTASNAIVHYNYSDGVPEGSMFNLIYDAPSNRMYFTTETKFGFFNPDSMTKTITELSPLITSIQAEGKEVAVIDTIPIELPYKSFLSLKFTSANFLKNPNTQYSYLLEGVDREWLNIGDRQNISFASLRGGNYTFRLRASPDGKHWFEMKKPVYLHILIPFYRTWWFLALIILFVLVIGMIAIYIYQRVKYQRILDAQNIRNHIAGDLHDDIGSSLSSIMLMSEIAQKQPLQTAAYLSQITATSGRIIENMHDIVWAANPENDTMAQVLIRMQLFASSMLEQKNIALSFDAAPGIEQLKLGMDERKNFYLIFKESIHNAYKYSEATRVAVVVMAEGHTITMTIEDNGKGFDKAQKKTGNGLANLAKRTKEINGKLEIDTAPGRGTVIKLLFKTTQTGS